MVNITERPCFGGGGGRGGAGRRGREGKGEGAACLLRHRLSTIRSRRAATCRNATRLISTVATWCCAMLHASVR